ncbi:MAG: GTP cyclohydrolase II [Rhodospirillaceae bacterium]|nr:GTP cyclohydrolase II [Rhodospirillaceae bacterium]
MDDPYDISKGGDAPSIPTTSPAQTAVDRAIADLRRGGMVILRHTTHRTAMMIQAAEMTTVESLRMLGRLTGSQPSLGLTLNRIAALKPQHADAPVQSVALPMTVDVDLVRRIVDPTTSIGGNAELRALSIIPERQGGLAESAIQLVKLSRLLPAVLFARATAVDVDRLANWSRDIGLLLVETGQVAVYPDLRAHRLVKAVDAVVPLADAEHARIVAFRPLDGGDEHVAIVIGEPDAGGPVLVRLHSQCLTGDLLGSLRCDCGDQLRGAISEIASHGAGILLYLAQEGRDIGLINKLRAYTLQDRGIDTVDANEQLGFDADERLYTPAAAMLRQLGVSHVRLLTNNPDKIAQLAATGIEVTERVSHVFPSNRHNEHYLQTKADRAGHLF